MVSFVTLACRLRDLPTEERTMYYNFKKLEKQARKDLGLDKGVIGKTVKYGNKTVTYLDTNSKNYMDKSKYDYVKTASTLAKAKCPSNCAIKNINIKNGTVEYYREVSDGKSHVVGQTFKVAL